MTGSPITRRDFIAVAATIGGGMALGFRQSGQAAQGSTNTAEFNPWIVIRPDNTIVLRYARTEMGQGASTATAMLIAEELHCDWSQVRCEHASSDRIVHEPREYLTPFQRNWESSRTSSSRTVSDYNVLCRQAGASARERLIAAAATQWNVPASECRAEKSKVIHVQSGREITYATIAAAAAAITLDKEPALKPFKEWQLLGTRVRQLDTPARVNGSLVYGVDVRLPNMLYATAITCPVLGGTLASYDFSVVANHPGVLGAVEVEGGIAVVADSFWRAKTALDRMPVSWNLGPNVGGDSTQIRAELHAALDRPGAKAADMGDTLGALASAETVVEAEYEVAFLDQAALEPVACTARVDGDEVEIWVSTQCDLYTAEEAAKTAGVPLNNVTMHAMHLGSSFGRREHRFGLEWVRHAVQIAKTTRGRPVKVMWTREQDMTHSRYRPNGVNRVKAGLDSSGALVALDAHLVRGSWLIQSGQLPGPIDFAASAKTGWWPYRGPQNYRLEWTTQNNYVPLGSWRGVWFGQNSFVRECFVDELALAARKDPYEYRRQLLEGMPDWQAVLDKVAKESSWGERLPAGTGRGLAIFSMANSIFAQVAQVSVSRRGQLRVERIVAAIDCRHAVNVLGIESQIEAGVIHALTAALYGEITIKDGRVVQNNYDSYRLMTIADAPRIETHIVLSRSDMWGGVGELPHPTTAPAVCNAIFAATGKRLRSLPIKNHDLSWTQTRRSEGARRRSGE